MKGYITGVASVLVAMSHSESSGVVYCGGGAVLCAFSSVLDGFGGD